MSISRNLGLIFGTLLLMVLIPVSSLMAEDVGLLDFDTEKPLDHFLVHTPERCMFGDFDALTQEMMFTSDSGLNFSLYLPELDQEFVEPFLPELSTVTNSGILAKVKKSLIRGQYKAVLQSEFQTKKQLAVLSICRDSKHLKSCNAAVPRDINQILRRYATRSVLKPTEDNFYFYLPVIVSKDRVSFFTKVIHGANSEFVSSIFKKEIPGVDEKQLKKVIENASILKSEPIRPLTWQLQIVLPMNSRLKCGVDFKKPSKNQP